MDQDEDPKHVTARNALQGKNKCAWNVRMTGMQRKCEARRVDMASTQSSGNTRALSTFQTGAEVLRQHKDDEGDCGARCEAGYTKGTISGKLLTVNLSRFRFMVLPRVIYVSMVSRSWIRSKLTRYVACKALEEVHENCRIAEPLKVN